MDDIKRALLGDREAARPGQKSRSGLCGGAAMLTVTIEVDAPSGMAQGIKEQLAVL